ncbi:MAG TPA: hypothetical protein VF029_01685 [Actinomycetota bacterium]
MSGPAIVWLVVGLVTAVAVLALLIALVRHVMVLARAARRFRDEVSPLARDIASEGDRAAGRSTRLSAGRDRPGP